MLTSVLPETPRNWLDLPPWRLSVLWEVPCGHRGGPKTVWLSSLGGVQFILLWIKVFLELWYQREEKQIENCSRQGIHIKETRSGISPALFTSAMELLLLVLLVSGLLGSNTCTHSFYRQVLHLPSRAARLTPWADVFSRIFRSRTAGALHMLTEFKRFQWQMTRGQSEIWVNSLQAYSQFRSLNPSVDIGLYTKLLDCAFT